MRTAESNAHAKVSLLIILNHRASGAMQLSVKRRTTSSFGLLS
jgi:hypothetical protein